MRIDWDRVIENLTVVLGIVAVGAIILTAGWFIGSANAHSTRVYNDHVMACIDKGANIKYVPEVGEVCTTDDNIEHDD